MEYVNKLHIFIFNLITIAMGFVCKLGFDKKLELQ